MNKLKIAEAILMIDHVEALITRLDPRPDREGLRETPARVANAWQHWTSGNEVDVADVITTFGSEGADELVFQGAIPFWSTCEHHLAPFWGCAHIGYIPNGKIIGLSKFARVLDVFARRLTNQERITVQVADALREHLDARGTGVVLQCRHSCMESRGVQRQGAVTMTSAMRGVLYDKPEARAEFMALVNVAASGMRSL